MASGANEEAVLDTPQGLKLHRFSVHRRSLRHGSPMGLPGPLDVLRGVMVAMQARPTLWAGVPANRQAFGDQNAAARTPLARERRVDRYHSSTGACCLVGEDAQERAPPRISDAFGEMVILEHIGRLQILMIDGVVLS